MQNKLGYEEYNFKRKLNLSYSEKLTYNFTRYLNSIMYKNR